MTKLHSVYIGLGSNIGNKFKNLQSAVDIIFNRIGNIIQISKVYHTPAMGFMGEDFNNACVKLETALCPKTLLKQLKTIEKQLGRKKEKDNGYQNRVIDLDILFYEDQILNKTDMFIPHPELQKRLFVLQPLYDIDKDLIHPIFRSSIAELLLLCPDNSPITPLNICLKNPKRHYKFSAYNFITIEGNIGSGKTHLATSIAHDFNAKLILERFEENPFLDKFYKNQKRYAFTLETSFLLDRYQQITDNLNQLDLLKTFTVSDYDIHKSLIFSKITLREDEFKLFSRLFYELYRDVTKPDLFIYLQQSTMQLQENIKKRGRKYEANIKSDYLEKIDCGYFKFIKSHPNLNVKQIDVSNRDFVGNRSDYLGVLDEFL